MKVKDVVGVTDNDLKKVKIALHLIKRKKKNPEDNETDPRGSFVDTFGGMVSYESPEGSGSVSSDTN